MKPTEESVDSNLSLELKEGNEILGTVISGKYKDGACHVSEAHIRNMGLSREEQDKIINAIKKDGRAILDK